MTRLEHFAAAALTGILSNHSYQGQEDRAALVAVKYAKALAEEIDRQFKPDCTDPDLDRQ